jgi:hypothetical protein
VQRDFGILLYDQKHLSEHTRLNICFTQPVSDTTVVLGVATLPKIASKTDIRLEGLDL